MFAYLFIVMTVFFWGLATIFDKLALRDASPFGGLLIRTLVVVLGLILIFPFFKYKYPSSLKLNSSSLLFFILSGVCAGLLGMFTYYSALKRLPASIVVPLCSVYPLISALLATAVLKEELNILRLTGVVLIILGVWLVK